MRAEEQIAERGWADKATPIVGNVPAFLQDARHQPPMADRSHHVLANAEGYEGKATNSKCFSSQSIGRNVGRAVRKKTMLLDHSLLSATHIGQPTFHVHSPDGLNRQANVLVLGKMDWNKRQESTVSVYGFDLAQNCLIKKWT